MDTTTIETRIQSAIRPAIARADRLLWELQNPRTIPGRHSDDFSVFWNIANPRMRRPLDRDDLTEVGP